MKNLKILYQLIMVISLTCFKRRKIEPSALFKKIPSLAPLK
ncbi:hypothetical protein NEOC95_002270 [Neochlamydia sp. AcF95]|nr:hypothetical protein [Neochlamydia sp. AcF95]